MQIKSQSKIDKKVLETIFADLQANQLIKNNIKNINLFFELFQKIKQHRTLQKICQVYTNEERQLIFQNYCEMIDRLEDHMENFSQFSIQTKAKRNKIQIQKQKYLFQEWKQAIELISYEGQALTQTIQTKLKLIIKAFKLNSRIPSLNWIRWEQICTEGILVKKGGYCGCFS